MVEKPTIDDLKKLKDACEKVLEDKELSETKLPTQGGFFFGSTDYDEYYESDLKHTIEVIDYCLSLPSDYDFVYHSSW